MDKKNLSPSKSEFYTNLMLITVLEALVLLIFQLAIFNASAIISMYPAIWKYVIPFCFVASTVLAVVFVVLAAVKHTKKSSLLPLAKFFVYFALMCAIMRYIPNKESVEISGKYFVNFERGQKIAGITSVIYVAASLIYYSAASYFAEKNAPKTKTIVHKKK